MMSMVSASFLCLPMREAWDRLVVIIINVRSTLSSLLSLQNSALFTNYKNKNATKFTPWIFNARYTPLETSQAGQRVKCLSQAKEKNMNVFAEAIFLSRSHFSPCWLQCKERQWEPWLQHFPPPASHTPSCMPAHVNMCATTGHSQKNFFWQNLWKV